MLETRQLLAGVQFNFVLNDQRDCSPIKPLLVPNLQAISQILRQTLRVREASKSRITPNRDYTGGPDDGAFGRPIRRSTATSPPWNTTRYEARTGIDPNGAERIFRMYLDPGTYFDNYAFLDPSGAARHSAPSPNRQNFISATLRGLVTDMGLAGYQFTTRARMVLAGDTTFINGATARTCAPGTTSCARHPQHI